MKKMQNLWCKIILKNQIPYSNEGQNSKKEHLAKKFTTSLVLSLFLHFL